VNFTKSMFEKYGKYPNKEDKLKYWISNPEDLEITNILQDKTKAVADLNEVVDNIVRGFSYVSRNGVLAEEPLVKTKFNLLDAVFHSYSIWRGTGQIPSTAKRVLLAAELSASPRLEEPFYETEIIFHQECKEKLQNLLIDKHYGKIIKCDWFENSKDIMIMKVEFPVLDSSGISNGIKNEINQNCYMNIKGFGYRIITDDPLDACTKSGMIVSFLRKFKGLKPSIPNFKDYF